MKLKYLCIGIVAGLMGMSSLSLVKAEEVKEYGVIKEYEDIVTQIKDSDDALVHSSIVAKTDSNGLLAIPKLKDSELVNVKVVKGTLEKDIAKVNNGSISYYVLDFQEENQDIEVIVDVQQEETYKLSAAKLKGTFPGDISCIKYKTRNTAPVNIESYSVKLATKENYILYEIVGYDPEEEFDIEGIDGVQYGTNHIGEVKSGETAEIAMNMNQTNTMLPFILWPIAILISGFFLYKNRDILAKAKEAQLLKKAGKK